MAVNIYNFSQSSSELNAYQKKIKGTALINDSFLLEVQGLQFSKDSLLAVAKNNVLKQQQELNYSLQDAARQFAKVSSSQRASAGASGLSIYSQSFLDVISDTASEYTRQVGRLKDVSRMNQDTLYQEAMLKAEEYNISIKSAEIQKNIQLNQGE